MALSQLRFGDSQALESILKDRFDIENIHEEYPNQREWYSPMTHAISNLQKSSVSLWIFSFTSLLSILLALTAFLLPTLAGLYFIGNPFELSFSMNPDIEITVVTISTFTCTLWIMNSFAIYALLGQSRKKGEGGDGSHIQRRGSRPIVLTFIMAQKHWPA